jgi:ABC-type molybdenum transport system ATPase subunit/photorepair protein PhrA
MGSAALPTPEPLLEMSGVDIPTYPEPDRLVLEGVTWTVARHEFWVVAGLQGTGKSELLLAAAGLLRPTRGACRLLGRDLVPKRRPSSGWTGAGWDWSLAPVAVFSTR